MTKKNSELLDELAMRACVENTISHRSGEYRRSPGKFIEKLPPEIREQLKTLQSKDAAAEDVREETIKMMTPEIDLATKVMRLW